MIPAIVLAAGRSARIGRTKALLPLRDGRTFLAAVIDALRGGGIDRIVAVVGRDAEKIEAALPAEAARIQYVRNARWEEGQLSSLLAGLTAIDERAAEAVLVTLIDMPLIQPATVAAVLSAFRAGPATPIVRAAHGGRHGHPVLFSRTVFDELRRADPAVGAKAVVRAQAGRVLDVEVGDPGCISDVDTWDDYERLIGPRPGNAAL